MWYAIYFAHNITYIHTLWLLTNLTYPFSCSLQFPVGKTSLITRFMYDSFDNTYQVSSVCVSVRSGVHVGVDCIRYSGGWHAVARAPRADKTPNGSVQWMLHPGRWSACDVLITQSGRTIAATKTDGLPNKCRNCISYSYDLSTRNAYEVCYVFVADNRSTLITRLSRPPLFECASFRFRLRSWCCTFAFELTGSHMGRTRRDNLWKRCVLSGHVFRWRSG